MPEPDEGAGAAFTLNGERRPWRAGLTLQDVVDALEGEVASIATSHNACFVPRARRGSAPVAPDDVVLVFQPIVGG